MNPKALWVAVLALGCGSGCKSRCYDAPQNHRAVVEWCDGGNFTVDGGADECNLDTDCTGGYPDGGSAHGVCLCNADRAALRSNGENICVGGDCHIDADCSSGYCSPTVSSSCGSFFGYEAYYCHTPQDSCLNDCDCGDNGYCAYSNEVGHWTCGYGRCAG